MATGAASVVMDQEGDLAVPRVGAGVAQAASNKHDGQRGDGGGRKPDSGRSNNRVGRRLP